MGSQRVRRMRRLLRGNRSARGVVVREVDGVVIAVDLEEEAVTEVGSAAEGMVIRGVAPGEEVGPELDSAEEMATRGADVAAREADSVVEGTVTLGVEEAVAEAYPGVDAVAVVATREADEADGAAEVVAAGINRELIS